MAWMAAALPYIKAAGTVIAATGAIKQGQAKKALGEYTGQQLEQRAKQERAVASSKASEIRRRARYAESRALALAAASGGGASDPTVVNIMAGIAGEGEMAAQTALYEGEERARGSEMGAEASRFEGSQAKRAGYMKAGGTVLSGIAKYGTKSLMEKYTPGYVNG